MANKLKILVEFLLRIHFKNHIQGVTTMTGKIGVITENITQFGPPCRHSFRTPNSEVNSASQPHVNLTLCRVFAQGTQKFLEKETNKN